MKLEIKFHLGQTVYVKETGEEFTIRGIDISVIEAKRVCFYTGLHPENPVKQVYAEDQLTSHMPHYGPVLELKDAERESERRRVHQELRKLADGYEFCTGEPNYYIAYEYEANKFCVYRSDHVRTANTVYFASVEDAFSAKNKIGSDRLRVYFDVER